MIRAGWGSWGLPCAAALAAVVLARWAVSVRRRRLAARDEREIAQPLPAHAKGRLRRGRRHRRRLHRDMVLLLVASTDRSTEQGDPADIG